MSDVDRLILRLRDLPQIEVQGVYTHFAAATDNRNRSYTEKQVDRFNIVCDRLLADYPQLTKHAAATAGTLYYPKAYFDMVRIGIGLFGVKPSPDLQPLAFNLWPILSWRTIVSEVKNLSKGVKIGYDLTAELKRDSTIAVLPIGYWHGLPRALSNKGAVLINGRQCPVLGRVCMNMVTVDVTDAGDIKVGDVATLIGKDENNTVTAPELSGLAGVSHYELLTRLNPLIQRYYI